MVLAISVIVPGAPKFTNLKAWFYSILKMISYSVEYSCILFHNFRSIEEHLKVRLGAREKHIVFHSACWGASGSFWKHRCGCSESLSRWVITSKPFNILLMHHQYCLPRSLPAALGNPPLWRRMSRRPADWPVHRQRQLPRLFEYPGYCCLRRNPPPP